MSLATVLCPECGQPCEINPERPVAKCPNCNQAFAVEDVLTISTPSQSITEEPEEKEAKEKKLPALDFSEQKPLIKKAALGIGVLCAVLIAVLVITKAVVPAVKYNSAVSRVDGLINAVGEEGYNAVTATGTDAMQEICNAYTQLASMSGYKLSRGKSKELLSLYMSNIAKNADKGDVIYLGRYDTDPTKDGKEPTAWTVLSKETDSKARKIKMLVISTSAICEHTYSNVADKNGWQDCGLRTWLNDSYANGFFTADELAYIEAAAVKGTGTYTSVNPGTVTADGIFILSGSEVTKFMKTDADRICTVKDKDGNEIPVSWWLRGTGDNTGKAPFISEDGKHVKTGSYVTAAEHYVRPAMYISIEY